MSTAPTESYNSIKRDETRFLHDQQSSESKLETDVDKKIETT